MIEEYKKYLETETEKAPLTITNYFSDLRKCLNEYGEINSITARRFIRSAKDNTRARRYYALQSYMKWAVKNGHLPKGESLEDVMERPKAVPGVPKPIPQKPYKEMIQDIITSDMLSQAEKTICFLLIATGRRVSEILKLKVENISEDTDERDRPYYTIVIHGKRGTRDTVFITEAMGLAYAYLTEYLSTASSPALFVGISYRSFYYRWNELVTKKYNIHRIRHTVAEKILNHPNGGREKAARQLGHRSPLTIERYATLYDKTHRLAMDNVELT